ncbi:MAG: transglycosylase SLT domain-containing protein [Methylococcaceae bacterium]|nr:transglycosylase SLT domain-containing protein [Methylococcaceae bacterium]
MKYVRATFLFMLLAVLSSIGFSDTLDRQRSDFLVAEKLIAQNNERAYLIMSSTLTDYPLYSYLQYQWLKDHLENSDKVLGFLSTYKDTRYAGVLRTRWLHYLAKHERWQEFLQHYQASENVSLRCQFHWANYKTGHPLQALNEAKNLWLTGDSQPEECEPLLTVLAMSSLLTPNLIWQRFELALTKDNIYLAEYVQRFMDKSDQATASLWLQVHKNPALIQDNGFGSVPNPHLGSIFAHGIDRMVKQDPDLAVLLWDIRKRNYPMDNATVHQLERRLGIALGVKKDRRAYSRLSMLDGTDAELREWKVRSALLEQNWQHVGDALKALTIQEQQEPRWQYWQARTLAVTTGNTPVVQEMYSKVAEDRSIYGLLAADTSNKPYKIVDKPVILIANELDTLSQEPDFRAVRELDVLNRTMEAQRQWWYAVNKLSKDKRMIAAKLAQQWQWDQLAILTMVKADYWDDLALRFPLGYMNHVQSSADRQRLDPAIILGLIRQESMLKSNAKSSVGARGLMQIMPKTGKQIAQELNEKWQSDDKLFNPDVNVRYGAYYFKQLLDRFNGNFTLATAAYNAGPSRVSSWLPKDMPIASDIWIETIPFRETRKYVMSVLSYAMIYQHRIQSNLLKLRNLFPEILPN